MRPETPEQRVRRLRKLLHSRQSLTSSLTSERRIRRELAQGSLVRVAHGWYVSGDAMRALYAEERHLLAVIATAANCSGRPVFSYFSAAVLHNLPLLGFTGAPVHLTQHRADPRVNSSRGVVRHREPLPPHAIEEIDGIRCTDLARTAVDIARTARPELALGCADAALRRVFEPRPWERNSFDPEQRRMLLDPLGAMGAARGVRPARAILGCADSRAESPLESVSRWYLHRLGFELALQVPVPSPHGTTYWVDFELLGLGIFGEADGRAKYAGSTDDPTAAQAHYDEKRRENWISGSSRNRFIRWGPSDTDTIERFAARLRTFGVPIPRRPPW